MEIKSAGIEPFLRQPAEAIRAVLIYGPDSGLVRERAATLLRAVAGEADDPFRVTTLSGAEVLADPARLADEAAALSLTGGRRVVRLTDAGDALAKPLGGVLDGAPGDALIIVEAGALAKRAALRKLFEPAKLGAAIACYADEGSGLAEVVRETLAAHGLRASRDALAYLVGNLGGDRGLTRRELEKLALYMGPVEGGTVDGSPVDGSPGDGSPGDGAPREVSLADAAACVGDGAGLELDDAALAAADGNYAMVDRAVSRLYLEGVSPVSVLRATARHFQRLHLAAARREAGASAEQAMAALRPPVFFKQRDRFRAQLGRWRASDLAAGLVMLCDGEIKCKSTGLPDEAVCSRVLMALANAGRRRRAAR
jgi:DNA polymerase-3 subunit delta